MLETPPVRVRGTEIQTALYDFDHPDTASKIAVVGTLHVGYPGYYDTITSYITNTELSRQATVHYEGIKTMPEARPSLHFTDQEELLSAFDELTYMSRHVLRAIPSAVTQAEGLAYQSYWRNSDLSLEEVAAHLGEERVRSLIEQARRAEAQIEGIAPEKLRQMLLLAYRFKPFLRFATGLFESDEARATRELDEAVFIDKRNERQLRAVDGELAANSDQNLILLWSPEHLPGIREGLEDRGYRLNGHFWLGALSLSKSRR